MASETAPWRKYRQSSCNGELQERDAAERTRHVIKNVDGVRTNVDTGEHAPVAAYRDLKFLGAAINRYFKHNVGGVVT